MIRDNFLYLQFLRNDIIVHSYERIADTLS